MGCGAVRACVRGLIVDDQGEEGAFGHPEEPAQGHQASEVFDRGHEDREASEGEHHQREDSIRSVLLAENSEEGGGQDVGHEEDTEDGVVLMVLQTQRLLQSSRLRVAEIGLVEAVEKVHHGQDGEDS